MCGFAGILDGGLTRPGLPQRTLELLSLRGPEGPRHVTQDHLALSNSRLAIVAPATAHLPVGIDDGAWVLAGAGQVFNHRELAQRVPHALRPAPEAGDLAVLLALFRAEGAVAFDLVRGPFSVAIWSRAQRTLWLARDRWGQRPLLYAVDTGQTARFATSLKAMASLIEGGASLDARGAIGFLRLGAAPPATTLLSGVGEVPPGHLVRLRVTPEGRVDADRPCRWRGLEPGLSREEVPEVALDRALRRVTPQDEVVNLALSGGVDSSAIGAWVSKERRVRGFTVVASEVAHDVNAERAAFVANAIGAELHAIPFALPDVAGARGVLARHADSPAAFPGLLHNDALHRACSGWGRVLLGGHCADEVFAGYGRYQRFAVSGCGLLSPEHLEVWPRVRDALSFETGESGPLSEALRAPGLAEDLAGSLARTARQGPGAGVLDGAQWLDFTRLNAWTNFALPDENALSHGLEVRSPFADEDLVDSLFHTAPETRVTSAVRKPLLRAFLRRHLPVDLPESGEVGFNHHFAYADWIDARREEFLSLCEPEVLRFLFAPYPDLAHRLRPVTLWRAFALSVFVQECGVRC